MSVVYIVAGARPNFMKIAPLVRAIQRTERLDYKIVHTGQHYDREMNDVFFDELGIPPPDVFLGAGGGSHAVQTGKIMVGFEKLCEEKRPDVVLVVGDVNSTLACSIVAKKAGIRVAHVEAGLRSGDMSMPEEINRIVTDSISDWFFVTEPAGVENLLREGHAADKIFFVGHVMIDNLFYQHEKLSGLENRSFQTEALKSGRGAYGVVTLHRPSNVDDPEVFAGLASALRRISQKMPLVFPVHPRTRANLGKFDIELGNRVFLTGPLAYMEFLNLWKDAAVVLTDSGGIQEETTALGIPCLTLRENTERPITVEQGTNILVGTDPEKIVAAFSALKERDVLVERRPPLWDGHAAERIVNILADALMAT